MTDDQSRSTSGLSPEKLALLVMRMKKKSAQDPAEAKSAGKIPRRASTGPAPLSFAQQRLWLLDQLEPESTAYNIPSPARLRGAMDVAALERALDEMVRRHESLRTTFIEGEGEPLQVVAPPSRFRLPMADLSGLPEKARRGEERRLLEQDKRPYNLARGPLFRVALVRLDREDHSLLLDMHHIVSDGWSFGVFFRELGSLYAAYRDGAPSPLPELPIQYADFAIWQREWLQGPVLEEQLSYWRERLAGCPPALELPVDRLRPATQSHRGGLAQLVLPSELTASLRELSRTEGTSLFMTLVAAFQLLLSRLSGQDDVVVGSPSAGRNRVEIEGLIGLFLNTLVLRTDLSGEPTFRELLERVKDVVLGAYRYQALPFERLLAELQPERQLSRTPIFQVLFNFVSLSNLRMELSGLQIEPVRYDEPDSKFDFTLYVHDQPQSLGLNLVYNADIFEAGRMEEMMRQLEFLLEQAVANPEARTGELSLVSRAAAILPDPGQPLGDEWMGAGHQALSLNASRDPNRIAVQDDQGETWTYGELERRANQLARFLLAGGVEKGDAVVVWAHRNASLVCALLGTLKSGAAFLILDPDYPVQRLIDYLRIGRPTAWVSVPGAPAPPVEVEEAAAASCRCRIELTPLAQLAGGPLAVHLETDPAVPVGMDDAACITFTSGSTGMPKGVVGRHGPLTHFYPWMGRRFQLGEDDCFGMLSALSHDPLQRDVLTPIWFGARLAVPDPESIGSPGYLAEWACREKVTVLHLTPAMMELVLDSAENGPVPVRELPNLRRAFVVGDALKRAEVERLQRLAPLLECVNLYGSTETQRSVSYFMVPRPGEPAAAHLGKEVLPLGRGVEDCQLLVINRAERQAGVGELGEINIRSPHLSRGYLGDEALTSERFLVNPFTASPAKGDLLYKSGDLGRYLPGGDVEFAGRADFQVKVRGFRIELGEVEAVLVRFPGVRECIAVVREDRPGDRRLVAYLVAVDAVDTPEPRDLRAFLGERLPDYMVPSAFVRLKAFPLTRTGKVDRRALPPPAEERREASRPSEMRPVEELVAGIWADLLGSAGVAPEDNFFEIGGHSLLATRVISRIRTVFGVEVPMRAVFEEPSLRGFADLVERALRGGAGAGFTAPPLVGKPRTGDLPLSFSQQRLWFLSQLEPESFAYNLSGAVRLAGPLDIPSLAAALNGIVRRHESLRTTFSEEDGEPRQVFHDALTVPLPVIDLLGLSDTARAGEARRVATAEARRPYDLAKGPLMRSSLVRLDEREHALLFGIHHIVSDGWSLGVLVRELGLLYHAAATFKAPDLPELPIHYADFAAWQREWLSGPALQEQIAWWTRQLTGAPPVLELPLDQPRPAVQSYQGGRAYRTIGRDLEGVSRRLRATPFMVLLGAFAGLLSRYGGQTDIVLGTPIANRGRAELEDLIGLFANTLALRTDLAGDPRFDELTQRVREVALGAYSHQEIPFDRLVDELRPERDLSYAPVFQVMFALQNLPIARLELKDLTLSPLEFDVGRTQFDLSLFCFPDPSQGGALLARLEYALDLFESGTAERLLRHLDNLLHGIADDPKRRLSELPLLATQERLELLAAGNHTAAEMPSRPLHELFEAVAAERPGAVAISCGGESVSYAELNTRANQLAHRLRRLGVGPEVLVAVCLERTPAMPAALLGVLKAGGAYVPIDPSYPADRLAWVLEDSRAAVLLTQSDLVAGLPAHGTSVIALDQTDLSTESTADPAPQGILENLAYVIYTSGSTGRPKGVAVRQQGIVNFLASMALRPGIGPDDVMLAVTTIAFDIAALELFLPLTRGARVELVGKEISMDGLRLADRIAESGASLMQATPATWRLLLEAGWEGSPGLKVLCGGEALAPDLARDLLARTRELWNVYGPTETTVWSAVHPVSAADAAGLRPIPLGGAIANTEIYLLDRFERGLEPVPPGAPGELYLGGEGLARGYLGRPDLTAERFVPDLFSGRPGSRLYRTGDLVRRRSQDGASEFLGRADHQVKIRGFRIELGEIEAVLGAHQAVREGAVVVREDVPGTKRLAAYLVFHDGADADSEALRSALREKLPEYMVPQLFAVLPFLPLTPNGKVDRRALLAAPAPEGSRESSKPAPPRNPIEGTLASVWAEVLRLDFIGIHDNFFALGGDSILVIQAATRSRKRGVRFTPRQLFQNQTVAQLAVVADPSEMESSGEARVIAPIPVTVSLGEIRAFTPLDFPEADLSQTDLDSLLAELAD